ncbi:MULTISPECIES: amidase domain-containing protein [unclassified Streptomyces]|uniref:amidase domain-containing protein n=1 Tax=unclassified Streptomyces TaxID=2593676 RepID=UPI002365D3C9|nr:MULTISPECIES: amidase domain-containing protein [unclassified Streptomyces]MDF3140672.1 amidase domain-containing protein [Streptomyces sp. T21Q-yed]WDF38509.1 amidase domain-containing protein [Streptomyces sp. T12]
MKSRKLSRTRRRATILGAAAASVIAGAAMLPNWSAGAAVADDPTVDARTKATFQRLADAVFTDRTNALVDGTQGDREEPLTDGLSGDVRLSFGLARSEDAALSTLDQRGDRLAELGEKYTKGSTTVTVDGTRVKGRKAKVAVTETTTLTYAGARGGQPRTTGFQAHHELTFSADRRGDWQLTGIRATDEGYLAVNQTARPAVAPMAAKAGTTTPSAPKASTSYPGPVNPKNFTASGLDYPAMAAYAKQYWSGYNPAYPDFNGQGAGGDCTNFVSQALKAGGWKHVPGYVYDYTKWFGNADIQSYSFVGVNEWSWFAQNSKRTTSLANVYQMDVGDVLQMDFDKDGSKDHTMIVTSRSRGVPYLTYHSTNTYSRSVSSIIASYPNALYYAYRT